MTSDRPSRSPLGRRGIRGLAAATSLLVVLVVAAASLGTTAVPAAASVSAGLHTDCPLVSDSFAAPPTKGDNSATGDFDCYQIPTPEGVGIAVDTDFAFDTGDVNVLNANGGTACYLRGNPRYDAYVCHLAGPPPYQVLLRPTVPGAYSFVVGRVAGPGAGHGCPVLPDSTFGQPAERATADLTGDNIVACYRVPPVDQGTQLFQYARRATGDGLASMTAFSTSLDATQSCQDTRDGRVFTEMTLTCPTTPGQGFVLLVDGYGGAIDVARHLVTPGAVGCLSVTPGHFGTPTSSGVIADYLDPWCSTATVDPTERLWFDLRTRGYATLTMVDDQGTALCTVYGQVCAGRGSTSYTAVGEAFSYDDTNLAATLGVWDLGLVNQPSPDCVRIDDVANGFSLQRDLDQSHSAVCVSIPDTGDDTYNMTYTDGAGQPLAYSVFSDGPRGAGSPVDGYRPCGYEGNGNYECSPGLTLAPEPRATIVFRLPEGATSAHVDLDATCASTPCGVPFTVPSFGPTDTDRDYPVTLTFHGTRLEGTVKATLSQPGSPTVDASSTAVSSDGTTAWATFDLHGVKLGQWTPTITNGNGFQRSFADALWVHLPRLENDVRPSLSEAPPRVDEHVTGYPGSWQVKPTSYSYQWREDGKPIPGATSPHFSATGAMWHHHVSLRVTAYHPGYLAGVAVSDSYPVWIGLALQLRSGGTFLGQPIVGHTITAEHGGWAPAATSYSYAWYADNVRFSRSASIECESWMVGKRIAFQVNAHRLGHRDGVHRVGPIRISRP